MQAPGVFIVGPTGKIKSWNRECEQLLGYPAPHAIERNITSLMDADDALTCAHAMKTTRAATSSLVLQLRHANASSAPFRLTLAPQYGADGRYSGCCIELLALPFPAVTAAAEDERERISSIPLKQMVDKLPLTFYILNQAGMMVMWNARVEQATQLTGAEIGLTPAIALFVQEDQQLVDSRIRQVFTDNGEIFVEARLCSKDGSSTPFLLSGTRFIAGGHPYLCGMGLDLTERHRQDEQLRLRERALHAISNGIVITRCTATSNPIEYINPAFERITGYRAAELLGRDSGDLCGFLAMPETDTGQLAEVHRALRELRETRVTLRSLRKTGEVFWSELTLSPVACNQGKVTHFITVINDVTESKQRTFFLEHEINHDVLTGLANRNLMWDRLEQAIHAAQRNKTLVAAVFVDLDNFKVINDTLGHEAGDEVLKAISRRMLASVRDSDTVARLGGDEFVLILANQPSLRYALRMIERVRANTAMAVAINGKEVVIESSMGVSIFPHDGKTAAELIQTADAAMYHAKSAGRNDIHFYSVDMKETTNAKHALEQHMRQAIANNEMFLLLQPRICLRSNNIVGAEALLRWRHPLQGVLLPAAFLYEAEENGLIVPLGEWVFNAVCDVLKRLKMLGFEHLVISMNVSFREFSQRDFLALIGSKLSDSALAPANFELEITESSLLKNAELSQAVFDAIDHLGIRLTIDEFGAGMSSLKNLQQLPLTNLKIFKPYIDNIARDKASDMMTRTIIGIGHLMNVCVIGEGVETIGQADFLKRNGCDQMQGNYCSVPLTMSNFEQLLHETRQEPLQ